MVIDRHLFCALGLLLAYGAEPAWSGELGDALLGGDLSVEFRYRYEFVDQEGFDKNARASILRTRLGYATGSFGELSAFLELDDLTPVGGETYDSTTNGNIDRPVVADPEGTEVNQAYLRWAPSADTELRAGRQRITLDDHRFVGNVGWRLNEQTYDGLSLASRALRDTQLYYAYLYNVNRVFGPDDGTQLGDWRTETHLFNLRYSGLAPLALTGYLYLMDLQDAPALSNRTIGLRASGERALRGDRRLDYLAEFARQADYGANPTDYDVPYWRLEGGIGALAGLDLHLGYEVLGGDLRPGRAFVTPLATLHAFQGWADQFLATPPAGIEDLYLQVRTDVLGITLVGVYHRFAAEAGGGDHGSEFDLSAMRRFADRYELLLKVAHYEADGFSRDTTKVALMLTAGF